MPQIVNDAGGEWGGFAPLTPADTAYIALAAPAYVAPTQDSTGHFVSSYVDPAPATTSPPPTLMATPVKVVVKAAVKNPEATRYTLAAREGQVKSLAKQRTLAAHGNAQHLGVHSTDWREWESAHRHGEPGNLSQPTDKLGPKRSVSKLSDDSFWERAHPTATRAQMAHRNRQTIIKPASRAHPTAAQAQMAHRHGEKIIKPASRAHPKKPSTPEKPNTRRDKRRKLGDPLKGQPNPPLHNAGNRTKRAHPTAGLKKPSRSLAYAPPPGGELFIDPPIEPANWALWDAARTALEGTAGDPLDEFAGRFIQEHWSGPKFTKGELKSAFALVKWITPNPHVPKFRELDDNTPAHLLQRAWAIEADLKKEAELKQGVTPARRQQLLGALSAVAFVLYLLNKGGYVPSERNAWTPRP